MEDWRILEIYLISAQGLKPAAGLQRRFHTYAVAWADPAAKLRTRVDQSGGENPTWNDKFVFRVPAAFLADDSASAISVEIYATGGGWYLSDSLVGTVRLLVSNGHLLRRPPDTPTFSAVGVRRPSGRIHGVLNVGATLLSRVPLIVSQALAHSPAFSFRDIMGAEENAATSRSRYRRPPPPQSPKHANSSDVLKTINRGFSAPSSPVIKPKEKTKKERESEGEEENEEQTSPNRVVFCGPCLLPLPKKIHMSRSDENLPRLIFPR